MRILFFLQAFNMKECGQAKMQVLPLTSWAQLHSVLRCLDPSQNLSALLLTNCLPSCALNGFHQHQEGLVWGAVQEEALPKPLQLAIRG